MDKEKLDQMFSVLPKNEMYRRGFLQALSFTDGITQRQWISYTKEYTPKWYAKTMAHRPYVIMYPKEK